MGPQMCRKACLSLKATQSACMRLFLLLCLQLRRFQGSHAVRPRLRQLPLHLAAHRAVLLLQASHLVCHLHSPPSA